MEGHAAAVRAVHGGRPLGEIGATQLISRLRIPDWAPRSWRFGFGARTGNAWGEHDFHSVDNIDVRLGRLAASRGSVRVELGLRGEWGLIHEGLPSSRSPALLYSYAEPIRALSILPSSGPQSGQTNVTVRAVGIGGGSDFRCAFDGVVVP